MADLVDTIRRDIKARLAELEPLVKEIDELQRALAALDAPRAKAPAARRGRTPRPRAATRETIVAYVRAHPGSTAGDVAKALDLKRNSTATRLAQLAKAGEIDKAERGYS